MTPAPSAALPVLQLSYVYDTAVPSQLAAPIQIINTGRQLCELGVATTIYTGAFTVATATAVLCYYGLTPHPLLRIVPLGKTQRQRRETVRQVHQAPPTAVPHVIMSRGEQGLALFAQLRRWPRNAGQRHVYEAHRLCFAEVGGWQGERNTPWHRLRRQWQMQRTKQQEQATVEGVDGLVCLTQGVAAALQEHFTMTAPTLILPSGTQPPAADLPAFATRDIDILYVGKLKARKGVFDLVAALRYLPSDCRLWLVGGTAEEQAQLRAYAQTQGVQARLVLPGYVEPTQVADLYRRARVGVCPLPSGTSQIAERFTSPLKVLEMMAHGTPIVATTVPALQELLTHGQTAWLVAPNSPAALAEGIATLLNNEDQAQALAAAARRAVTQYTWAKRAQQLYTFLATLA